MILHHVLEGAGPAVLLLHSTAADARQWRPQIRELRGEVTAVAPDLRGYGRSRWAQNRSPTLATWWG